MFIFILFITMAHKRPYDHEHDADFNNQGDKHHISN